MVGPSLLPPLAETSDSVRRVFWYLVCSTKGAQKLVRKSLGSAARPPAEGTTCRPRPRNACQRAGCRAREPREARPAKVPPKVPQSCPRNGPRGLEQRIGPVPKTRASGASAEKRRNKGGLAPVATQHTWSGTLAHLSRRARSGATPQLVQKPACTLA